MLKAIKMAKNTNNGNKKHTDNGQKETYLKIIINENEKKVNKNEQTMKIKTRKFQVKMLQ